MKRNLITAIIIVTVAIGICWFLKNANNSNLLLTVQTNEVTTITNVSALRSPNSPQLEVAQSTNETAPTNEGTSESIISNYETISDLRKIKSLKLLNNMYDLQNWFSQSNLVAFQLKSVSGKPIAFTTDMMWVLTDKKDGHVRQLDLHSPELNIDQVRQIGLQLEEAWGLDSSDFLAWCDKVGNKWLDAPLFTSRNGLAPSPSQYIGFSVNRTMNDEKPWVVEVGIQDK